MLNISLIAVGSSMPDWVTRGYNEYEKRIRGRASLRLIEIPALKRSKNADLKRIMAMEEKKIDSSIPADSRTIVLDRRGRSWSTREFAEKLENWIDLSENVAFLIGGPEGLTAEFIARCDESWSLSRLTFAHPIARVVVAEQLYRCLSIIEGGPYHR